MITGRQRHFAGAWWNCRLDYERERKSFLLFCWKQRSDSVSDMVSIFKLVVEYQRLNRRDIDTLSELSSSTQAGPLAFHLPS